MMISVKLQMLCLMTSFIFLIMTIKFIKNNMLSLKYSFIWLLSSISFVIMALFPRILIIAKNILGIEIAANAIFLIICYFILLLLFGLTIIVSSQSNKIKILNQELAILQMKIEKK